MLLQELRPELKEKGIGGARIYCQEEEDRRGQGGCS